jgi:class 3 adenylate cyclase
MAVTALLDIDVYRSTFLIEQAGDSAGERGVLAEYQHVLTKVVEQRHARRWRHAGNGAIFLFDNAVEAVDAGMWLLREIGEVNRRSADRLGGAALFPRVAIHQSGTDLSAIVESDQAGFGHSDLNVVAKLQQSCPLGRIAITAQTYAALPSFWRPLFRPSLVQEIDDAVFVLSERLITPQEEALLTGMPEEQRLTMPPIPFLSWETVRPGAGLSLASLADLLTEPLVLIFGESSPSPRKGPLAPAATSDAVGVTEVMAALRSNPDVRAAVDIWSDTADLVAGRHVLLVGSGTVNAYAFAINGIVANLQFAKSDGRILNQVRARWQGGATSFGIHGDHDREAGFVFVCRSPFDREQSLVWVAGTNGMATQAAALMLKDLVVDGGSCLRNAGLDGRSHPIGCVVVPAVERERNLQDYYQKWRISDYRVVWAVDGDGNRLMPDRRGRSNRRGPLATLGG